MEDFGFWRFDASSLCEGAGGDVGWEGLFVIAFAGLGMVFGRFATGGGPVISPLV